MCVTHHLSHTSLPHTSLSTTIFQPPSVTHIFVTHIFVNHHLSHTSLSTTCQPQRDIHLRFAWQARHLATSAFISRGRHGTWRHPPSFCVAGVALKALGWLWWRAWTRLVASDFAAVCVAGVALGDIRLRFTWQAWHFVTFIFVSRGTLRGRCGFWRHLPSFHVAGVPLGDIHLRFAWQV